LYCFSILGRDYHVEDELEVVGNVLKEEDEESDESIENLPETEDKSQSSEEDMVIPPEDAEAIQELEKNVGDEKQDITNIQSNDNDFSSPHGSLDQVDKMIYMALITILYRYSGHNITTLVIV
jgi:hypothetical protein